MSGWGKFVTLGPFYDELFQNSSRGGGVVDGDIVKPVSIFDFGSEIGDGGRRWCLARRGVHSFESFGIFGVIRTGFGAMAGVEFRTDRT